MSAYGSPRWPRAQRVARWFSLKADAPISPGLVAEVEPPGAGEILLITGPSGSGKSTLLGRGLLPQVTRRVVDVRRMVLRARPLVESFGRRPLTETVALLSRVGLAEAHTFVLMPGELSEGQRFRFRLALALHRAWASGAKLLVCDEFASSLDPVTAAVVCHAMRRLITRGAGLGAVVVTSNPVLGRYLRPDRTVECDFGR